MLVGTADPQVLARGALRRSRASATEALTLLGVETLQIVSEIERAGADALLPPGPASDAAAARDLAGAARSRESVGRRSRSRSAGSSAAAACARAGSCVAGVIDHRRRRRRAGGALGLCAAAPARSASRAATIGSRPAWRSAGEPMLEVALQRSRCRCAPTTPTTWRACTSRRRRAACAWSRSIRSSTVERAERGRPLIERFDAQRLAQRGRAPSHAVSALVHARPA